MVGVSCSQGILMDLSSIVHSHPEIVSGEPVFVGTRVPARNLLDWLEGGHTLEEFLDNFPSVSAIKQLASGMSRFEDDLTTRNSRL